MKIRNVLVIPFLLLVLTAVSCGNSKSRNDRTETVDKEVIKAPEFNADSAYQYIQVQADFGPRVPNTQAHKECGEYLAGQLEKFGAKVYNQYADLIAYDGTILKSRNIIGAYKPESIDIVFFDSEDYGIPEFYDGKYKQDTWCLGSQYWARTPHVQNYNARYGILLDMVGGKDATFYYEGYSARTARSEMKKIWKKAHELGYGKYFVKEDGGETVDDHIYVNKLARIPCVDIINYDAGNPQSSFGSFWHTVNDTMENIDRNTLKAVGQTVMDVIYNEK